MVKRVLTPKLNISVVLPSLNEEGNIVQMVSALNDVLPRISDKYEIIIVNDGSTDNTSSIAHKIAAADENVIVIDQENKGYGGSIKSGIKASKYEWVFITDADCQFDLKDLYKFAHEAQYSNVVIGYRANRAEGLKRLALAKLLKIWNIILLGFPYNVKDIDCAFKLINRDVFDCVGDIKSNGAMFSTELLLKIHRAGFLFTQVGVSHYPRLVGKQTGNSLKVILRAVKETSELSKTAFAFESKAYVGKELTYSLK